ncbi:MAG: hypothetical protein LBM94_00350 [Propionibacteriaceae bacterium]|nr:hypothetical protein [Propionibacteriaceae bacterium]
MAGITALGEPSDPPTPSETAETSASTDAMPPTESVPEPTGMEEPPASAETMPPAEPEPEPEPEPDSVHPAAPNRPTLNGAPALNAALRATITGATDTVFAGQTASVNFEFQADGLSMAADAGVLVVIPAYQGVTNTTAPSTGNAAIQYEDNYTVPGTDIVLPHALLIWKLAESGGVYIPNLTVNYLFDNGSTPNGFTFPVQAYIFEAVGIPGINSLGTGVVPGSGYNHSSSVTLTSNADETWSVLKSIVSPANVGDQVFTDLRNRSYVDVITDGDAEDNYTIIYNVKVESDKAAGSNGRLFMSNIHVSDTLSGFLATGAPKSVEVKELLAGGVNSPVSAEVTGSTDRKIEFDVPDVPADGFSSSRTFEIAVVFDKDNYTNRFGGPVTLTAPHHVSNQAALTYTPASTGTSIASAASTTDVAFGWNQQEPTLPTLTINKQLLASATLRNYTLEMAKAWEANPALTPGSSSNVQFTLTKVIDCGVNSRIQQNGPTALSRTASLILNNSASLATFTNVTPACYRLFESAGTSPQVTAGHVNITNGLLVQVTEPDASGVARLYVDGLDYTTAASHVDFTNTANSEGWIKIYTKRQQAFMSPVTWDDYHGSLGLYLSPSDTTPEFTGVYSGTDSTGDYVLFESVPLGTTYYVKDESAEDGHDRWVLQSVDLHVGAAPSNPSSGTTTVTVENSSLNVYTAFLQSNYGGMRAGKVLRNADGTYNTTTLFVATYKLYPVISGGCSAAPLQELVNGTMQDVTFTLGNRTAAYVGKEFPGGDYCVREVSLVQTGTGTDLSTQWALYQGDNLRVSITAGSYAGQFVLTGGDAQGLGQPANGVVDPGTGVATFGVRSENVGTLRHVNVAKAGQLVIRNYNAAGAAVSNIFTITKTDFNAATDSWWDADGTKDTTSVSSFKEFVPAGTYTVTAKNPAAAQVLWQSMGYTGSANVFGTSVSVTVVVAAGTPTVGAVGVSPGVATGGYINNNVLPSVGESAQTAVFDWKYKPVATLDKRRVINASAGVLGTNLTQARFSLYRLAGADYVFVATYAPSSTGLVTTTNLEAGTYLLAETTVPNANFVKPSYITSAVFPTTTGGTVAKATAESYVGDYVRQFTVATADYANAASPLAILSQGMVFNVPFNTITITKKDAASATLINGVVFHLCSTADCSGASDPLQTATSTGTGTNMGKLSFTGVAPGTYYVREASAPSPWLRTSTALKVEINDEGWPTLTWEGTAPPTSSIGGTTYTNASTVNTTTVTWTNAKAPSIKWEKSGQLMSWDDDGNRESEPLHDACFVLVDDLGQYYELDASNNVIASNPQPGGAAAAAAAAADPNNATRICSDPNGIIQFNAVDPERKYTFTEVVVPPIPGHSGSIPPVPVDVGNLEYDPIEVQFSFAWRDARTNPAWPAGYYMVWGHDNGAEHPSWYGPAGTNTNPYYELLNTVAEYHIEVYKLPIKLTDGSTKDGGFSPALAGAETDWDSVVIADAKFNVYVYDADPANTSHKGVQVDVITVTGSDLARGNVGWSKGLPAGLYVIEEAQGPFGYGAVDQFGTTGNGVTAAQGNQATSVYYQGPNKRPSDISMADGNTDWIESTDVAASGATGHGIVIELGQGPLGVDDPNTPENEGDRAITFGDSNRIEPDPSKLESRLVRDFGEKDGYRLNVLTGQYERASRLGGIEFDVYPAYRDATGQYVKLPTIGNVPITTVRSNDWGSAEMRQGQFLTEYFDIARVFYCSTQPSGACSDWETAWIDTNGDSIRQPEEYTYKNYAKNVSPNSTVGATMADGPTVSGMINWAAVTSSVKYAHANEYTQWSVVFVEKALSGSWDHPECPGAPDASNNYCSPLPEAYDWDPSKPPAFGVSMDDRGMLFTTYYANGDSAIGTPACSTGQDCTDGHRDPAPFIFVNYRGTGFLTLNKFSEVQDSEGNQIPLTGVNGATFELYAVDPAYADFSSDAGKADALAHATLVAQDRSTVPVALPITVGPEKTLKLLAGTYLLVETGVSAQYNAYGTFTSDACPNSGECSNDNQKLLDRSGPFETGKAIGPIYVPEATGTGHATIVNVVDKLRPGAAVINTWSGAVVADVTYTADYTVSAAAPASWLSASDPVVSAGDGAPSGDLLSLEDGTYTIDLGGVFDSTKWNPNAAASANVITFKVANSRIVTTGVDRPRVGASTYLTSLANVEDTNAALGSTGNGLWYVANADGSHVDFYVNHVAKGQLVVLKGGIDNQGELTYSPAGLTSATFNYEYVGPDASCPVTNNTCTGSITWTPAANPAGGARQSLDPGIYKVTEDSIGGTGWIMDTTPVYVRIEVEGAVYLTNNPGGTAAGSDQAHPQLSSNASVYFYNTADAGTFEIKKFASATSSINLAGAEFDVYATLDGTTPDGVVLQHVTYGALNKYEFTIAAGDYVLRETVAPSGYGLRDDYIPITVTAGAAPYYVGFDNVVNVNAKAVLDPLPLKLDVAKETTFPAIGTPADANYVPERMTRVSSLPMYLWQRVTPGDNSKANFDLVAPSAGGYVFTRPGSEPADTDGPNVGAARFEVTRPGEYRITELVSSSHAYLMTNCAYKVQEATWNDTIQCGNSINYNVGDVSTLAGDALLGRADSIFVVYDPVANKLVLDTTPAHLPADWVGPTAAAQADPAQDNHYGELIVNNPFVGYVITVQKFDAFTGEVVTVPGAGFGQYDTELNAEAGGHGSATPPDAGKQQYIVLGNGGLGAFNPDYTSTEDPRVHDQQDDNTAGELIWWIREEAAPTGYALSDWFDNTIKKVSVDATATTQQQYVVRFADGKTATTPLSVGKDVLTGAVGSGTNPVTTSLINNGFSTTYTVQPNALGNTVPLVNYTVADGSATTSAFKFYGPDKTTGIEAELLAPPTGTGPMPQYSFTTVRIGRTVAYKNIADLALDWDGSLNSDGTFAAPGSSTHVAPVWARVNGGAWQLLDVTRTFTVPTTSDGYINVEYTSAIPGTSPSPFDHSASPAVYAGDPFVGAFFTPGVIEVDVTFDKWVPTYQRPEISRIDNTVTVSGTPYDGPALSSASDTASIAVPVVDRAKIAVGLGCTDAKCDPAYTPDINQRKFFPGQNVQFTVSSLNEDATLSAEHPVLVAYMDPDMFSAAKSGGNSIYTAYFVDENGTRTPYPGAVNYTESGSVGIWEFPDLTLAPHEKIQVDFTLHISDVLVAPSPTNYAYATSGVWPLLPTDKYPTGSAIDSDAGCRPTGAVSAPNFAHCGDQVFDQTSPATPGVAAWRTADWDRLAAISGFDPAIHGLFVRTEKSDFVINSSGSVSRGKFVKVNSGPYSSSETPSAISLGDEVTFRLVIENGQDLAPTPVNSITNLRIADVLPFENDGRGTLWDSTLRDLWEYKAASLKLYTSNGVDVPAAAYNVWSSTVAPSDVATDVANWLDGATVSTATPGITADATSFYLDFGAAAAPGSAVTNYTLPPGEVLFVEYTMVFNGWQSVASSLLQDNANATAVNNFSLEFQAVNSSANVSNNVSMLSNNVGVQLKAAKVAISGVAWEDVDYDGTQDTVEDMLAGVPVELWSSVDGGAWAQMTSATFPTETDASGEYEFTGLESSAGDGSGPIEYQVRFGVPAAGALTYTAKDAAGDDTIDSDVWPTTTTGMDEHSAGTTEVITLYSNLSNVDVGMYRPSSISGTVWEDLNNDGIQNDDQSVTGHDLSLVTARLTGIDDIGESIDRTVNVAADGSYSFDSLKSGSYTVAFDRAALDGAVTVNTFKWGLTHQGANGTLDSDAEPTATRVDPDAHIESLPLAYAGAADDQDAGVVPFVHVSGFAWFDTDCDGALDASESKAPGVKVTLWSAMPDPLDVSKFINELAVATTTTDANGNYLFDELLYQANTVYKVAFVNPDTHTYLFTNRGTDHSATNVVETKPGDPANEQPEANTAYFISAIAHSDGLANAGLRSADRSIVPGANDPSLAPTPTSPVVAPTGGSATGGANSAWVVVVLLLWGGVIPLLGAVFRKTQED